jgi:hypothetical protein
MGWVVSITPLPRFTPGERTPGTHCTGGWVGPRPGLDTETRGKILCRCRGSNPDRPVVQPVVRHYTDWATPALFCNISNRILGYLGKYYKPKHALCILITLQRKSITQERLRKIVKLQLVIDSVCHFRFLCNVSLKNLMMIMPSAC